MINTFLASTILLTAPTLGQCLERSFDYDHYVAQLDDAERDRIWREIHFCIQRMNHYMKLADREANKITEFDVRSATVGVIEGTIAGLASANGYGVVIGGCLGGLARIAGDSYIHFIRSRDYVYEAEFYAYQADQLQEILWRDN